jgi:uncharacterized protein YcfJ
VIGTVAGGAIGCLAGTVAGMLAGAITGNKILQAHPLRSPLPQMRQALQSLNLL